MTGGGQCTSFKRNFTDPLDIRSNYGGIAESLAPNFLAWLFLLVLFLIARKNVFNVMSRGLKRNIGRMNEVLFSRERETQSLTGRTTADPETGAAGLGSGGFLAWLSNSLKCLFYSEKKMLQVAGEDAVKYLRFQRYLIAFVALLSLLSISVILPLNFQGEEYLKGDFSRTTFSNLKGDSSLLYLHTILAFLLFPASILLMKKFSEDLKLKDSGLALSRTLLIRAIPPDCSTENLLRQHFSEAYPDLSLSEISLAYEVTDLTLRTEELEDARDARRVGEQLEAEGSETLMMYPKTCSRFCGLCCSCCSEKVRLETANITV